MLTATQIVHEIELLPKIDRIKIIDSILDDVFVPDPEIEKLWLEEAVRRLEQYDSGKIKALSYEEVMSQFKK